AAADSPQVGTTSGCRSDELDPPTGFDRRAEADARPARTGTTTSSCAHTEATSTAAAKAGHEPRIPAVRKRCRCTTRNAEARQEVRTGRRLDSSEATRFRSGCAELDG